MTPEAGLVVTDSLTIPTSELAWRFSRSSGPGGQGVNTTDSRVELIFSVAGSSALTQQQKDRICGRLAHRLHDGVLTIAASEHRSQLRNREAACERLAELLRMGLRPAPKPRRESRPSRAAKLRRLEAKRRRSDTKSLRRRPEL